MRKIKAEAGNYIQRNKTDTTTSILKCTVKHFLSNTKPKVFQADFSYIFEDIEDYLVYFFKHWLEIKVNKVAISLIC